VVYEQNSGSECDKADSSQAFDSFQEVVMNRNEWLEPTEVIEVGEPGFAQERLESYVGYAADIMLVDGHQLSGVIVAVSATALIVECWDSVSHRANGDLSTVAIGLLQRISIP
jgi:hypothetical protein